MTILVANPRGNKIGNWTLWIKKSIDDLLGLLLI